LPLFHLDIPQDLAREARPDRFPRMTGHDSCAAIRMPKKMVTAANPHDFESGALQCRDDLVTAKASKPGHD